MWFCCGPSWPLASAIRSKPSFFRTRTCGASWERYSSPGSSPSPPSPFRPNPLNPRKKNEISIPEGRSSQELFCGVCGTRMISKPSPETVSPTVFLAAICSARSFLYLSQQNYTALIPVLVTAPIVFYFWGRSENRNTEGAEHADRKTAKGSRPGVQWKKPRRQRFLPGDN